MGRKIIEIGFLPDHTPADENPIRADANVPASSGRRIQNFVSQNAAQAVELVGKVIMEA